MTNTKMEGLCEDISRKGRCVKQRVGEGNNHEGNYEKYAVTSVLGPPLNLGRTIFIQILHTHKNIGQCMEERTTTGFKIVKQNIKNDGAIILGHEINTI